MSQDGPCTLSRTAHVHLAGMATGTLRVLQVFSTALKRDMSLVWDCDQKSARVWQ